MLVPKPQHSTILAALKKVNPIPARSSPGTPELHQIPILTHGVALWEAGHAQLWNGGIERSAIQHRKAGLGLVFVCW